MATKKGNTISTKAAETKAEPKQVTVSSILNAEAEKKTTAKATTEKKVVATEAKKVTETKKTTAEAKKAPAKKAEETKATAKTTKKTTAKKTTARKAAKKPVEKITEVYFEYNGEQILSEELVGRIQEAYKNEGHRISSIKTLRVYINPDERKHTMLSMIKQKESL